MVGPTSTLLLLRVTSVTFAGFLFEKAETAVSESPGDLPEETSAVATLLQTTLCVDRDCSSDNDDCQSYVTPLNECYNCHRLFPDDPSWGNVDIWDELLSNNQFRRSFFASTNATCMPTNATDVYFLPLDECIGPFGKPRPWGIFSCVNGDAEKHGALEPQEKK